MCDSTHTCYIPEAHCGFPRALGQVSDTPRGPEAKLAQEAQASAQRALAAAEQAARAVETLRLSARKGQPATRRRGRGLGRLDAVVLQTRLDGLYVP